MKSVYVSRLMAIVFVAGQLLATLIFVSCSDADNTPSVTDAGDRSEIYAERLAALRDELISLRDGAEFGDKKGQYPVSARSMLDDQIQSLDQTIVKLKNGTKRLSNGDMDRIIDRSLQLASEFRLLVRTEDFKSVAAELQVNGRNGGYIDFGAHAQYSHFGDAGSQRFTVEFWMKLTDVDRVLNSYVFLISTFTEKVNGGVFERNGWNVNLHMSNLRATYAMGTSDLFEPGFGFDLVDQWVHIALVTNEKGVDGETFGDTGKPVMMKMYVNGTLSKSEASNHGSSKPYASGDPSIPMVAFTGMSPDMSAIADKSTDGRLKHFHIWESAKTQLEIQNLMNHPESVTGLESDLVCGWDLSKTTSDDNAIPDLTGQFHAELVGDYRWIE